MLDGLFLCGRLLHSVVVGICLHVIIGDSGSVELDRATRIIYLARGFRVVVGFAVITLFEDIHREIIV